MNNKSGHTTLPCFGTQRWKHQLNVGGATENKTRSETQIQKLGNIKSKWNQSSSWDSWVYNSCWQGVDKEEVGEGHAALLADLRAKHSRNLSFTSLPRWRWPSCSFPIDPVHTLFKLYFHLYNGEGSKNQPHPDVEDFHTWHSGKSRESPKDFCNPSIVALRWVPHSITEIVRLSDHSFGAELSLW